MSRNVMNDNSEQMILLESLYDTMSKEADGLYKQMIAICTAFLGGTCCGLTRIVAKVSCLSL